MGGLAGRRSVDKLSNIFSLEANVLVLALACDAETIGGVIKPPVPTSSMRNERLPRRVLRVLRRDTKCDMIHI
jgi:hypothetical protein